MADDRPSGLILAPPPAPLAPEGIEAALALWGHVSVCLDKEIDGECLGEKIDIYLGIDVGTRGARLLVSTRNPVTNEGLGLSVERAVRFFAEQFGFEAPKLDGPLASLWKPLFVAKIYPSLAVSIGKSRTFAGRLDFEEAVPIPIPLIDTIELLGVQLEYRTQPKTFDFGVNVKVSGRESTLRFPFALPTPKPPLFDLRYFGIGQRVSVPDVEGPPSIARTIGQMKELMRPKDGPAIMEELRKRYAPESNWLVGAEFAISDLLTACFLFNDPVLYGLRLEVSKAALAGLKFEILYKRISDEVGVFFIDLTLPVAFRSIMLGPVALTLPSVSVSVYNNGDFEVAIGWPLGERSITVQVFPYIGGGALYFARLSSATAPSVPPGLAPVLAFGIALRLGLGKEIRAGILTASFSIYLYGIFEGRLGFRAGGSAALLAEHAGDRARGVMLGPVDYYWFRGTFGIVGLVEGAVDFSIIKARVLVRVEASATVTFETGKPTLLRIQASVMISLEIEIGGFRIFGVRIAIIIPLRFRADLTQEFVLQPSAARPRLAASTAPRPLRWRAAAAPARAAGTEREVVPLWLATQLTVVGGQPMFVTGLTIEVPPESVSQAPFGRMAAALGRWMVACHLADGDTGAVATVLDAAALDAELVTESLAEDLRARLDARRWLNARDGDPDPLTYAEIIAYLREHFEFEVGAQPKPAPPPAGSDAPPAAGALPSAVFPMFGEVSLQARKAPGAKPYVDLRFSAEAPKSELYRKRLAAYYEELEIGYRPPRGPGRPLAEDEGTVPMVELLFEDYAAVIVRDVAEQLVARARRGAVPLARALEEIDYRTLAAKLSRVMQAGLRLPRDLPEKPESWPRLPQQSLYVMTGQQFPLEVEATTFSVQLAVPESEQQWLRPRPGDAPLLEIPEGDAEARSALARLRELRVEPNVERKGALPWLASRPAQFNLRGDVAWRVEGPTPASLRLVPLGEPIAALARARGSITLAVHAEGEPAELPYRPAFTIPLTLSPVARARRTDLEPDGTTRAVVEHVYQLAGASEEARRLLTALLNDPTLLAEVQGIALAYPATVPTAPGLASQADARILLAKTNLATTSNPEDARRLRQGLRALEGLPDPQWATPAERTAFLTLLWECSIVNSGGFYLRYAAADGTDPLASRFAGEPTLPVSVIVTLGEATDAKVRAITPAIVVAAPAVESASWQVDVRGERSAEPQVPAGCVGFWVERKNPRAGGGAGSMEVEVAALYNLLQYRVAPHDGSGFMQSMWSVPVGPAEGGNTAALPAEGAGDEPALWRYHHVPAVYRFALPNADQPVPNRYAGMGDAVHLEFRIVDAYGNLLSEGDPVGLPLLALRYADRLFPPDEWPGSRVTWRVIAGAVPRLELDLRYRMDAVVPGAREGAVPTLEQAEAAASALAGYDIIYDQVRDPNAEWWLRSTLTPDDPHRVDPAPLALFVARIREGLGAVASGRPFPPVEAMIAVGRDVPPEVLAKQARDLFELAVALEVQRVRFVDDAAALEIPAVRAATCHALPDLEAPPEVAAASGVPPELERFAREFEGAFPGLKVALGRDAAGDTRRQGLRAAARNFGADDRGPVGALWAVRVGAEGITVTPRGTPSYYAPRPLCTRLLSGEFVVRKYPAGRSLHEGEEGPELFENVDLDAWGWTFLDVFDRFLEPELALAIATLDPKRYDATMQRKEQLARAIAARIAPVLLDDAPPPAAVAAAEGALYQRLLVSLAAAYEVSAIAQCPVEVRRAHPVPGPLDRMRFFGGLQPTTPLGFRAVAGDALGTSYTSPRVDLWPARASGADPARFTTTLTTLVTPARGDARTHDRADLRFDVGYLEHDIPDDSGEEERHYLPGAWLRFVVTTTATGAPDPAVAIALGRVDVPLALRRFPRGMRVHGASATPSVPHPVTLEEALRWTMRVELGGELTAHDIVRAEVRYNVSPAGSARVGGYRGAIRAARPAPATLFEALARFTAEYEPLMARFGEIPAAAWHGGDVPAALAVIDAFLELASGVADTWGKPVEPRAFAGEGLLEIVHAYEYAWRDTIPCQPEAPVRPRLRVRRLWHDLPPTGWPPWPVLEGWNQVATCPPEGDAPPHQDAFFEARPVPPPALRRGAMPSPEPDDEWRVALERLHVMTRQNVVNAVQVVRNVDLVPDRATSPAFTYVTPWSASPAPIAPRIEVGRLSIDDLGGDTLAEVLGKLFSRLFALESADALVHPAGSAANDVERRRLLSLGVQYSHTSVRLGIGQGAPRTRLPLRLAEEVQFIVPDDCDPNAPHSVVRRLADSLGNWYRTTQPSTTEGQLHFALTLFGNFSTTKSPILRFRDLVLTVSANREWWTR